MPQPPDTERLRDMIPFYVNGTLPEADRAELETAMAQDPQLREEIAVERKVQERLRAAMQAELDANRQPATFDTKPNMLMGGIAAPSEPTSGGLAGALSFLNPRKWKPAVTLALAAAAVGQLAVIAGQSDTIGEQGAQIARLEADNYALASGKCECDGEAMIVLEVAQGTSWRDLAKLLSEENLLITRSTAQGVLMLRHVDETAETGPILDRLNASPLISSAAKAA